ncbi:isocitrate lyase [Escherichia coli]|uniref:Isocitrate lyase n=1 Tax=Escherichia coli TaxID=562 RepID=A0A376TZD0_ECOLX|nr:isocitrate lyase [Escherichia coli]
MHPGATGRGENVASAACESKKGYINSLGALTGGQALQQAKAGIEAVYLSGWQVAADANLAASMYPDQSLYPANSVPAVVERINNTFRRADQIQWSQALSRAIRAMSITSCRSLPMRKPVWRCPECL